MTACYADQQARAIAKHIPYVIGMNASASDDAALEFAVGFYDALGAGRSIKDAFQFGCNAIALKGIPEHLTPVLIKKRLKAAERQRLESSYMPGRDVCMEVSVMNEDASSWNRGDDTVLRYSLDRNEKQFWAWRVAVESDDEFDDEPRSTRYLIKRQRTLGESPRPIDRLRAVVLGGALSDRLNGLSDRQIGQLLFDFCWPELYVDGPELIIVTQAIDRLRRSTGGAVTNEEAQEGLKQQPVCPKCGHEMFLHYGIDECDFWLCDYAACRHKRYVGEQ